MLLPYFQDKLIEAGTDEAGRGCMAGPVFAAAVILPKSYQNKLLNDSKKLNEAMRYLLREQIEANAIAYSVASVSAREIDNINILNASFKAMHLALDGLPKKFEMVLVDGNRFLPYKNLPHQTIVKGDGKYLSIAAASILAKTYRDDFMNAAHAKYPHYGWQKNKGYGTAGHRKAMLEYGLTDLHRKSFRWRSTQLSLL